MISMNLNASGTMSVPLGYPIRLSTSSDNTLQGVIPSWVTAVSAVVQTEAGTANAHLALITSPTTSNGADKATVAQADLIGLSTSQQTITVSPPVGSAPATYVVRLFVDNFTGSKADTISRDGVTATSAEPRLPVAVRVSSVTIT